MNDRLTITLNTTNRAPSQYLSIPFDSAIEFNGKLVYFGETGIFEEGGDTDDGEAVVAWVDTPNLDFGKREQKSIEAFDVGYEATGSLALTLYGDEDETNARSFTLTRQKIGEGQQDGMQTLKKYKYGKSRYWKIRVANVSGCDFSLDYLALAPVFLKRQARNA